MNASQYLSNFIVLSVPSNKSFHLWRPNLKDFKAQNTGLFGFKWRAHTWVVNSLLERQPLEWRHQFATRDKQSHETFEMSKLFRLDGVISRDCACNSTILVPEGISSSLRDFIVLVFNMEFFQIKSLKKSTIYNM